MAAGNPLAAQQDRLDASQRAGLLRGALTDAGVTRSVILASTFRSGSTFVAETLRENGISGLSIEKFNMIWEAITAPDDRLREALDAIAATAMDGFFATKIMWPHRNDLADCLGFDRAQSALLAASFPGSKWLWVKRQDKIRQAISFWRARKTNRWHVHDGSPEPAITYDFEAIRNAYREIIMYDDCWGDFFAYTGITPYSIDYETFLADQAGQVEQVFDFLGMPVPNEVTLHLRLRQQRDHLTDELYDQFMHDCYRHV